MLSFQILDGGEVLTFALESRAVVIGTAADCDIRLRTATAADHHARVELVRRDGALLYKLVDLGSPGGTRVNGEAVAQIALAVGDRIEIAGATLVLGKHVVRRTTADEVLADSVRTRLRRPRAIANAKPWLPYAIAGGVVVVLLGVWLLGSDRPPASLVRVPELLAHGDHEEADRLVQHARVTWASNDAARLAVLDGYAGEVSRMRRHIDTLEKEVISTTAARSIGEQIDELRRREASARDAIERAAARRVIARVHELRQLRPPRAPYSEDQVATATPPKSSSSGSQAPPADRRAEADMPSVSKPAVRDANAHPGAASTSSPLPSTDLVARAEQALARDDLRAAGGFIERLAADPDFAAKAEQLHAQWKARMESLQRGAKTQADELVALGRGSDASAYLRDLAVRLPDAERDHIESYAQVCAAAQPAALPPVPVKSFVDPLGDLLRLVEAGENAYLAGDFGRAQQQFTEAARQAAPRDAAFAAELRARTDDSNLIAGLHSAVARGLRSAAKPDVRLADDQKARLLDCDGARLRFAGESGEILLTWPELPATAVDAILRAVDPAAEAFLGAAVLALSSGDESLAEQRLLGALRKDATVKPRADVLLARARGERVPESGYRIDGGRFADASKSPLVKELDGKLSSALKSDAKAREHVLSDVLGRGPDQLDTVIQVLRRHQRLLAERLQNHPFKKNWERLAAERQKLDAARTHALALIFDEDSYFYPYSPPAVSSEKAAQYHAVQRDVDERVDAVRALWEGGSLRFTVPENIATDLERFRWVSKVLDGFGERSPAVVICLPLRPICIIKI